MSNNRLIETLSLDVDPCDVVTSTCTECGKTQHLVVYEGGAQPTCQTCGEPVSEPSKDEAKDSVPGGRSYRAIAKELGISHGQVRRIEQIALRKLRTALQKGPWGRE